MVRPKTHTRESSRGMLTLTEEEASRRSGGSPAQSPCHSLPSGRPRRRESEPIGPQRPVRDPASQSEESSALWWRVGGQMRKWTATVQLHLSDDKLLYQALSQGGALQQLLHLVHLSVNRRLKGQIQHRRRFCSCPVLCLWFPSAFSLNCRRSERAAL